jgi:hypothetical protein
MVDDDDDESFGDLDVDDGEGGDGSRFDFIVDGMVLRDEDCAAFRRLHRYPVSLASFMYGDISDSMV